MLNLNLDIMYYAEEIVKGVLCFKTTPKGEWEEFTKEQLSERVKSLNEQIGLLLSLIDDTTPI